MKRNKLSPQTTLLIIVILALAAAVAYYFVVYQGFNRKEDKLRAEISDLHLQIEEEQARIDSINFRKKAIEEGKKLGSTVEPFDNSNTEWAVISGYLKKFIADNKFSVTFKDPPVEDVYVRRTVTVSFEASDLDLARAVLDNISDCKYRNIITKLTLKCDAKEGGIGDGVPVDGSFTITFIESNLPE